MKDYLDFRLKNTIERGFDSNIFYLIGFLYGLRDTCEISSPVVIPKYVYNKEGIYYYSYYYKDLCIILLFLTRNKEKLKLYKKILFDNDYKFDYEKLGRLFGYPECCIKEFNKNNEERFKFRITPWIPCCKDCKETNEYKRKLFNTLKETFNLDIKNKELKHVEEVSSDEVNFIKAITK